MRFNKALVFARLLLARCFPAADKHGVWNMVNHKDGERDKHSSGEEGEGFLGYCYMYVPRIKLEKDIYRVTRKTFHIFPKRAFRQLQDAV